MKETYSNSSLTAGMRRSRVRSIISLSAPELVTSRMCSMPHFVLNKLKISYLVPERSVDTEEVATKRSLRPELSTKVSCDRPTMAPTRGK